MTTAAAPNDWAERLHDEWMDTIDTPVSLDDAIEATQLLIEKLRRSHEAMLADRRAAR